MHSYWFAATVDLDDAAAQEEAISNAELVFKYIAETYIETPMSHPLTTAPKPATKSVVKTPSFLASTCSFQ